MVALVLSYYKVKAQLDATEAEANAMKGGIQLYMGNAESLVYDKAVIATWKTGSRGRSFRLKEKNIETLIQSNTEDDS